MTTNSRDDTTPRGTAAVLPPHVLALIRERRRRIAALPRYDRYIGQAAGHLTLQGFWRNLKRQDQDDIQRMKNWLDHETASASVDDGGALNPDPPPRGGEPCRNVLA